MLVVRPVAEADYPAILQIANDSGVGFTSLPASEDVLKARIANSMTSFAKKVEKPGNEGYLLVMENTDTNEIVGTSGLQASVGLEDVFNNYRLGKAVHSSKALNLHNTIKTLTLCNDLTGASEVCTLFLKKNARSGCNGQVLSRFRFLFLAEFRERFANKVIAEMRGVSNENGHSPFWVWLQEHFFNIEFSQADYLIGTGNKSFITELMPRFPIYVNLLSKEAQKVIGQVHKNTIPALQLLKREGFSHRGYVDIFDAGPTVECDVDQIKGVKESLKIKVRIGEVKNRAAYVACNTDLNGFRAGKVDLNLSHDQKWATISPLQARTLNIKADDFIRILPL